MSSPFGIDKEELKRLLPIREVLRQLREQGNDVPILDAEGRGLCPFHDDTNPSFRLWNGNDPYDLWWCDVCKRGTDIFHLIQGVRSVTFPEALDIAQKMYDSRPANFEQLYAQAPKAKKVEFDQAAVWQQVAAAQALAREDPTHLAIVGGFVPLPTTPQEIENARRLGEHLISWGWGKDDDGSLMIPHYDANGSLTGVKLRRAGGAKTSIPGSSYTSLYGAWRGRRFTRVIIAEGETDALFLDYAAAVAGIGIDVYALPSGAGQKPTAEHGSFLGLPDELFLCFDADEPGIRATENWITEMNIQGFARVIRVCRLPFGMDVREAQPEIEDLLRHAQAPLELPDDLQVAPVGYMRSDGQGGWRQATNWTATPIKSLVGGPDPGFEIIFEARRVREEKVVKFSDLASVQALNRWANRLGMQFLGSDADRKRIAEWIEAKGSVVPEVFSTAQVGTHKPPERYSFAGGTLVLPDDYFGKVPYSYVASERYKEIEPGDIFLPTREAFDWRWLEHFLELSDTSVTHPLLAWLVASTRRHEVRNFPILFVGGSSGVGKSTLAGLALRLMGSNITTDLGSVTPFVLLKTLASSTNIPVFVDEWTRLSRPDTREAFQSNIPTLYSGGRAERGQADLTTTSYPLTSPVIVAGEDTFKLTREKDRTVVIHPSRTWQNPSALHAIEYEPLESFGMYVQRYVLSGLPLPEIGRNEATRPLYNRAILEAGWKMILRLIEITGAYSDVHLPFEPDFSCFEREATDDENTYAAVVTAGLPLKDSSGNPVAWIDADGHGTWIRPEALITAVERNTEIKAPGSKVALLNYFREEYGEKAVQYDRNVRPPGSGKKFGAALIIGFLPMEPDSPFA